MISRRFSQISPQIFADNYSSEFDAPVSNFRLLISDFSFLISHFSSSVETMFLKSSRRSSQISPQIFADNFVEIVAVNLQFRVLSSYFQLLTSHFLFFISLPALKQCS